MSTIIQAPVQGDAGPTGPPGPTGDAGPAGADGATGDAGPAGADGSAGADGATGSAGPAGADGATGDAGPAGADGATGSAGTTLHSGLSDISTDQHHAQAHAAAHATGQADALPPAAIGAATTTHNHSGTYVAANGITKLSVATSAPSSPATGDMWVDSDATSTLEHNHAGTYVALSTIDAAADLLVGTGNDAVGRLAKGSALQTLRVNSGATALEWATPSGGGYANSLRDQYLKPAAASFETFPRWASMQTASPGALLMLSAIVLPAGLVVGRTAFMSSGASSGLTHWWMGLFDTTHNLLAVSADQLTAQWPANTLASLPIAATAAGAQTTFTTTYEGIYYLGVMQGTGTPATLRQGSAVTIATGNLPPILAYWKTGVSTTPPTFPYQVPTPTPAPEYLLYGYVGP